MIKGVNKRIVEISGTQNEYFEKAILYIRPERNTVTDTRIELEAHAYLGSLMPEHDETTKSKEKLPLTVKLICVAAILLSITMIICLISML